MQKDVEEWRDVVGYEGLYVVSDKGNIAHVSQSGNEQHEKPRVLCNDGRGYLQITLVKDGVQRTHRVHRLVAEAFIPNPCGYKEINHKDECKHNNCVQNLEWCTRSYNVNYGSRTEKTSKKVEMLDKHKNFLRAFQSIREAARSLGVKNPSNIARAVKGERKSAYGYLWREIT